MRVYGNDNKQLPVGLVALVIFVVLLAIVQFMSRQYAAPTAGLQQQFAASPPAADAGRIELPPVPTNLAGLARTTVARIFSGDPSAPLDTSGESQVLRVEISRIEPVDGGLHLTGSATNISGAPLDVTLDSFKFTDASGMVYASTGSPATSLQPRQSAPLDITLPIPATTQLQLRVEQAGQQPIELMLLNTSPTPTP